MNFLKGIHLKSHFLTINKIMSIHAKLNPEAQARLAIQRRNSSISSAVISVLVIVIIGLILGFILLPYTIKETPVIVTYAGSVVEETEQVKKKVQTNIQRKPSSPSSSMARVIAASTVSNISIPVPDKVVAVQSLDFGDGDDFGSGWGDGSGDGDGGGGGGASFFNQKVSGERIAYVIDYSKSMEGERESLMRQELTKSVEGLSGGVKFQMIFFSGPAWVAGSEVPDYTIKSGKATVKSDGEHKYEWTGKGTYDWTPKGKKQHAKWLDTDLGQLREAREIIKTTPLSLGTDWENPLLMAFDMQPPPQIVFFMTDGAVSGRDMMGLTKDLAAMAKKKGIVVNTIAMMEPKANEPMADLAKRTGGQFTIIGQDGKAKPGGNGKAKPSGGKPKGGGKKGNK